MKVTSKSEQIDYAPAEPWRRIGGVGHGMGVVVDMVQWWWWWILLSGEHGIVVVDIAEW